MAWIGRKKLALIPVYRPNALAPDQIPLDWNNEIMRRVLFDPDPNTGEIDRFVPISSLYHRPGGLIWMLW